MTKVKLIGSNDKRWIQGRSVICKPILLTCTFFYHSPVDRIFFHKDILKPNNCGNENTNFIEYSYCII